MSYLNTALKRLEQRITQRITTVAPFPATVDGVDGDTVTVKPHGATTAETQPIAHLPGPVDAGDRGVVVPMPGGSRYFMPLVLTNHYSKRLNHYTSLAVAVADLPNAGADGGEIQVDGEVTLGSEILSTSLLDNIHVIGRGTGATRLLLDNTVNWPALYGLGKDGILLADMTLERASGGTSQASQIGVQLIGPFDNAHLERLVIDGFYGGIRIRPGSGYTAGTVDSSNLTMRDVQVLNTLSTYGIEIAGVDGYVVDNCEGSYSVNDDGLKIGGRTLNGTIIGGRYTNNGQEGIDAFTGGQNLTIIGPTCDDNTGGGIIIKTDNVSESDPANLAPRNLHIVAPSCKGNGTYGVGVYKMNSGSVPADIEDQVALSQVVIDGGEYIDNYTDGLYVNARNVTVNHPISRLNGRHGIYVADRGLYVTINNPVLAGNGGNKAIATGEFTFFGNEAANLWIRGQHVALRGGTLLGVDADTVTDEASLAALTKISDYNVYVSSQAGEVYIDPDFEDYAIESPGMVTGMTSGTCIIHGRGTRANPATGSWYGSVGSTYTRTNVSGFPSHITYTKRDGAPNAASTGWFADTAAPTMSSLPTAASGYEGHMIVRTSDNTLHVCVSDGGGGWTWKQVTLV